MHNKFSLVNWENKLTSESDQTYFALGASDLHPGLTLSVQNLNSMQGFRPELQPLPAPLCLAQTVGISTGASSQAQPEGQAALVLVLMKYSEQFPRIFYKKFPDFLISS